MKRSIVLIMFALLLGAVSAPQVFGQAPCCVTLPASNGVVALINLNGYPGVFPPPLSYLTPAYADVSAGAVAPGVYPAWCADVNVEIDVPVSYTGWLFSSCDSALWTPGSQIYNYLADDHPTAAVSHAAWLEENWILNHRAGYDWEDVQLALWSFVGGPASIRSWFPDQSRAVNNPNVQTLVANAIAAVSGGWTPGPGDKIGVLMVLDTDYPSDTGGTEYQLILIEVPCPGCTGQIGDFVWNDLNGNGCQDAGEPGIPGVTVNLYNGCPASGAPIATTTTDANGKYLFSGLCAGSYTVGFTTPNGFVHTVALQGCGGTPGDAHNPNDSNCDCTGTADCGVCVTLPANDSVDLTIDCGYKQCMGQIGDFVWNDLNGNGCQDAGEPGIPGVKVDLYSGCPASGAPIATTTTDANGNYLFSGLCAGTYTVGFNTPNGFVHTLANQNCNGGGTPNDATDSDCNCSGADNCGVCVTLPANNSVDLTIDCGYVGGPPCLTLTKTADAVATTNTSMGYTYSITNCGGTTFNNLAIIDDAGTPNFPGDDFTVASGITLNPGDSKSYHVTVPLPIALCTSSNTTSSAGQLIVQDLGSSIKVIFRQSRDLNDNVYGTPAPADGWSSHTFGNLTGSDKAEFRFTDGNGKVVLDFFSDYISATTSNLTFPSGYASLGPNGGDGSMVTGAKSNVLFYTSTLADNLNNPANGGFPSPYTVNSPTPESSFPNWDYVDGYTVIVSKNAFGAAGFGGVTIPFVHNSPAKTGNNQVSPSPCGGCITNTANVVTVVGGTIGAVLATDDAVVCVGTPIPPTPACIITKGAVKIDKKTIQIPLKNNGTANIVLSEVDLTWKQAVNGNLVSMSLNGAFWAGSAASPAAVTSGFNADANRRTIAKGQTKTLVLTFQNNADKVLTDYSGGVVKFGTDVSCTVTIP